MTFERGNLRNLGVFGEPNAEQVSSGLFVNRPTLSSNKLCLEGTSSGGECGQFL